MKELRRVLDLREIQETVYIAVSTILLALVLGFISIWISIRNDMASIRNEEIISARTVGEYRKFNKYDNKIIYGDEVVEIISLYGNTGITIYVDTPDGVSSPIIINEETIKTDPSLLELSTLQNKFQSNREYKAQIVYNAVDPRYVIEPMEKMPGSEVTGISLKWIRNN